MASAASQTMYRLSAYYLFTIVMTMATQGPLKTAMDTAGSHTKTELLEDLNMQAFKAAKAPQGGCHMYACKHCTRLCSK